MRNPVDVEDPTKAHYFPEISEHLEQSEDPAELPERKHKSPQRVKVPVALDFTTEMLEPRSQCSDIFQSLEKKQNYI